MVSLPLLFATLPRAELGPEVALPAAGLAIVGVVALLFARRKARPTRLVQILETASLGPKRSLIVARVGSETLILGASEAGIALLGSRLDLAAATTPAPVPAPTPAAAAARAPAMAPRTPAAAPAAAGPGFLGRLFQKGRAPAFEPLLRESFEDQELRAKVAAGLRGTVS